VPDALRCPPASLPDSSGAYRLYGPINELRRKGGEGAKKISGSGKLWTHFEIGLDRGNFKIRLDLDLPESRWRTFADKTHDCATNGRTAHLL
jgi:hypothetical protein